MAEIDLELLAMRGDQMAPDELAELRQQAIRHLAVATRCCPTCGQELPITQADIDAVWHAFLRQVEKIWPVGARFTSNDLATQIYDNASIWDGLLPSDLATWVGKATFSQAVGTALSKVQNRALDDSGFRVERRPENRWNQKQWTLARDDRSAP